MKRRIRGIRRSIASCLAPPVSDGFELPRSRLRKSSAPRFVPSMLSRPTRVSLTISGADMQPSTASHESRRARIAGRTASACSSMNSIVATMMSAFAIESRQFFRAAGSFQSAAAWKARSSPGMSRARVRRARSTAPARWLSRVTMMKRGPARSAAEVGFGFIERAYGDRRESALARERFGVAPCASAHEERNLLELALRLERPACRLRGGRRHRRLTVAWGAQRLRRAAEMRRRSPVMELGIVAEHRQKMLLEAHHERMDPRVEQDVRTLEAHLWRVASREILNMDGRRDHSARDAEALGDVALHLRAQHELGMERGNLRLDLEIVVGDQAFGVERRGGFADLPRE